MPVTWVSCNCVHCSIPFNVPLHIPVEWLETPSFMDYLTTIICEGITPACIKKHATTTVIMCEWVNNFNLKHHILLKFSCSDSLEDVLRVANCKVAACAISQNKLLITTVPSLACCNQVTNHSVVKTKPIFIFFFAVNSQLSVRTCYIKLRMWCLHACLAVPMSVSMVNSAYIYYTAHWFLYYRLILGAL